MPPIGEPSYVASFDDDPILNGLDARFEMAGIEVSRMVASLSRPPETGGNMMALLTAMMARREETGHYEPPPPPDTSAQDAQTMAMVGQSLAALAQSTAAIAGAAGGGGGGGAPANPPPVADAPADVSADAPAETASTSSVPESASTVETPVVPPEAPPPPPEEAAPPPVAEPVAEARPRGHRRSAPPPPPPPPPPPEGEPDPAAAIVPGALGDAPGESEPEETTTVMVGDIPVMVPAGEDSEAEAHLAPMAVDWSSVAGAGRSEDGPLVLRSGLDSPLAGGFDLFGLGPR